MQNLSIRIDLEKDLAKKFQRVKDSLGQKTNTAVLIQLINEAYQKCIDPKIVKEALP